MLLVIHGYFLQGHVTGDRERRLLFFRFDEGNFCPHVHVTRKDLEFHLHRHVSQVVRDVEVLDIHVDGGLEGIGKGLASSLDSVKGVIDPGRKTGLDEPLDVGRDVRQKGNADPQFSYRMFRLFRLIREIDAPVLYCYVVQSKFQRF